MGAKREDRLDREEKAADGNHDKDISNRNLQEGGIIDTSTVMVQGRSRAYSQEDYGDEQDPDVLNDRKKVPAF